MSTAADTVTYAARWSEPVGGPVDELDEDEAQRRHEAGELYTAILGDGMTPRAYVEVRLEKGFVGVHFLDDDGRNFATYLFGKQADDDALFLERATWREYDEDGELVRGEAYFFKPDGTIHVESKDYVEREASRGDKRDDVSGNWEPVPEFGRYESVTRLER
jgi:hypothetical protein